MELSALLKSYEETKQHADRFREALQAQLSELLRQASLPLAVPIESRTKNWASIVTKVDRLALSLDHVKELWDLVGFRLIFLLSAEAARACNMITQKFDVVHREDTGDRLKPKEFGYQSVHFIVRAAAEWLKVPTLQEFKSFLAEIQVRTLSQHNWAVASRLLQYNQEADVPVSVQRSLHRVAALLELVDLELERVSEQRAAYRGRMHDEGLDKQLNVDLLIGLLDQHLPESHRVIDDDYVALLHDLGKCKIKTARELVGIIHKHLVNALTNDAAAVQAVRSGDRSYSGDQDRVSGGVFYSHVGLVQNMLNSEFGTSWRKPTE